MIRLSDLVLLTLALPVAHSAYVLSGHPWGSPTIDRLWFALVLVLLSWIAAAMGFEIYGPYRARSLAEEIGRIARALGTVALVLSTTLFYLKHPMSRLLTVLYLGAAFALVAGARAVARFAIRGLHRNGYIERRYAVVGRGKLAEDVTLALAASPNWGFRLAGFVVPDGDPAAVRGTTLGKLSEMERILDEHVIDHMIFAVPRGDLARMDSAMLLCEEQGVDVMMCLEPLHVGPARMSLLELGDRQMLVMSRTPYDAVALAVKRVFDVVGSALALVVLAPVLLAISVAIRLESPGPVFFRQRRLGRNGRPFTMLKFRSMYVDAEGRLSALSSENEVTGPVFKMKADPRVTRVGQFIRRTSLDELPQFWNVLRGDMSIVGPRPPIPAEAKSYKRWQRRRLSMKPGITCIWQVSGRNEIQFERWMELDLEYIDNWTLWLDLRICLKTVPAVLGARGVW